MEVYTMEQWNTDRDFKAVPGQEITEQIYDEMLNCMPPEDLPRNKAAQALDDYDIPVHAGFLMGEPHSTDADGRALYMAFGMHDYGKGKHYYYLGLARAQERLNGQYYYFDCLNAIDNDGLLPAATFANDADAIRKAADYEATLYKCEYRDGERINSTMLYEPTY